MLGAKETARHRVLRDDVLGNPERASLVIGIGCVRELDGNELAALLVTVSVGHSACACSDAANFLVRAPVRRELAWRLTVPCMRPASAARHNHGSKLFGGCSVAARG